MVKVKKDLTNKTFGRLLVLKQANDYVMKSGRREAKWLVRCSCPNKTEFSVLGSSLKKRENNQLWLL
jgi:6-phosphogluconate dehydrogenase (decarboxylating)